MQWLLLWKSMFCKWHTRSESNVKKVSTLSDCAYYPAWKNANAKKLTQLNV